MNGNAERNKKLRTIEQIDYALSLLGKPISCYHVIVDTLSIMQLKAIKGELFEELQYKEDTLQ